VDYKKIREKLSKTFKCFLPIFSFIGEVNMQDDLLGKVVIGRNTPGYYYKNSAALAPGRAGVPRTDAERQAMHHARYGTATLPPRGTGLGVQQQQFNGDLFWPFMAGLVLGAIIFTQVGRGMMGAAGKRITKRIEPNY